MTKTNPRTISETSKDHSLRTKAEDEILKAALALGEVKVPQSFCTGGTSTNVSSFLMDKPEISKDKSRERIIPITIESNQEDDEEDDENMQLAKALQMSLQNNGDDIDQTLKLRLDLHTDNKMSNSSDEVDEDDELRKALQLSLECVTAPPTPDAEDLRWRRLNHFSVYSRTSKNETPPKLNT